MHDRRELIPNNVARQPGVLAQPGCYALGAAALAVAVHVWLARGVFVPIVRPATIEYVFVSATIRSLIATSFGAGALTFLGHVFIRRSAAKHSPQPPLLSSDDVAYVRPLWWFAATLLSLLNLVRPRPAFLAVVSYVVFDLRGWWSLLLVLWLSRRLDARLNGSWRRWIASFHVPLAVRRWLPEVTLAAVAIGWSVLGTPILRSAGGTIGDEPKYVRYCETLYQGLGFEISQIKAMSELPADFRPRVWRNFVLLVEILPRELGSLASDAVEYVRNPAHQFNRARHHDGGFLTGKDGGTYQVHNPGLSLLMFPAYYVDRTLAEVQPGSPAQWPTLLPTVNAFFLAVYAGWTILIFRFLRKCGAMSDTAWAVAVASTLTLPASAFPFQYYPELVAGLFISAVGAHILFGDPARAGRSLCFGLLAGYLPWLHVRFLIVMVALAVGAIVLWRGQRQRIGAFLAGIVIPGVLFCLYAYRISGSVLPSALWMAEGSDANFNIVGMFKNSVGYLVDREWGLFAHSPVFLLALPGYWWLARRQPKVAFLSALVFLALLLPAAGKTLVQTTPMRLIVAVVPFGATPLIEVLGRRSRAIVIAFGLLLILSLDVALAYNLHHYRHYDTLVDWSFSGWKVNLLFPQESRRPWSISAANGFMLVGWIVVVVVLVCAPAVVRWAREQPVPHLDPDGRPMVPAALTATLCFVALGTAVSAATGVWTRPKYLLPPDEAAVQAALMIDDLGRCTVCASSISGGMGTRRMMAALEAVDSMVAMRRRPGEERDYGAWLAMASRIRAWYVEANGHEPGDREIGHYLFQWREDRVPASEIRRLIFAAAEKSP